MRNVARAFWRLRDTPWDRGHLARRALFSCGQDARGPRLGSEHIRVGLAKKKVYYPERGYLRSARVILCFLRVAFKPILSMVLITLVEIFS